MRAVAAPVDRQRWRSKGAPYALGNKSRQVVGIERGAQLMDGVVQRCIAICGIATEHQTLRELQQRTVERQHRQHDHDTGIKSQAEQPERESPDCADQEPARASVRERQ
jgi:hypothetical protein